MENMHIDAGAQRVHTNAAGIFIFAAAKSCHAVQGRKCVS